MHPFCSFILALSLFFPFSTAHTCTDGFLMEISKSYNLHHHCNPKTLEANFAWSFENKSRELRVAFGAILNSETAWLAWGLNPIDQQMVGTRALIGIKQHDGSLEIHKYSVTDDTKKGCPFLPSDDIGLNITNCQFVYMETIGYYCILATIFLPREYNFSRVNVSWQIGEMAVGSQPLMHAKALRNFDATETLDLVSGEIVSHDAHYRHRMRMAHGILNMIGWGILLPIGVIIARYFKEYPKSWTGWRVFHVSCQCIGYVIGSLGWALGIYLGHASKSYYFCTHRILGIIIFTFSTTQMMALRLKPKCDDSYRKYWNMYHHFLGYGLITLIWFNIFEGMRILAPDDEAWKWGCVGVLGAVGAVFTALEGFTWIKFFLHRK